MGRRRHYMLRSGWLAVLIAAGMLLPCVSPAQVVPVGLQEHSVSHLAAEQGDAEQGWFPGTANLLFAAVPDSGIFQGFAWYDGGEWRFIGPRYEQTPTIRALGVQHWGYGPMDGMHLFASLYWGEHASDSLPVLLRHEFWAYGSPPPMEWMPADSGLARGENADLITAIEAFYFSGHTPPQPVLAWSGHGPLRGQTAGRFWEQVPLEYTFAFDMDVTPQWFGDHLWAAGGTNIRSIEPAVFRSTDKGASWRILRPGAPPGQIARVVTVCPMHPDTAWIGMDGSVLRTMDGGATWSSVLQVESGNVIGLESDPMYPGTIFAASSGAFELYRSSDFGDSWRRIQPGPGKSPGPISCTAVALMDSLPMSRLPRFGLFLGTQGTGVWVYDMLFSPTEVADVPVPAKPVLTVYPNPVRDVLSVELTMHEPRDITIDIVDMLGRVVRTHEYGEKTAGKHVLAFMLHDVRAGIYLLRVSRGMMKMVLVE